MKFDRGVFTVSFDFELIWGTLDQAGPDGFRRQVEQERAVVVDRVLALLDEFGISATWLVIGHLFLDRCERKDGVKHPEIVRPTHAWVQGDWFQHDPDGDEVSAPLFLGRSLVEKILACPTPQEIGCHSFCHVIYDDPGCSRETANSDLAACVRAAAPLGITPRSFAFPRNRIGHLDLLRRHGFLCYRGPEHHWYSSLPLPPAAKRVLHLAQFLTESTPSLVHPERQPGGVWNLPGSMIYMPRHGLRRWISTSARVRRARKGLRAAAATRGVFHLWTHPTNLVDDGEAMFGGLREIFAEAAQLRDARALDIRTMGGIAAAAEAAHQLLA